MIRTTAIRGGCHRRILVWTCRNAERRDVAQIGIVTAPLRHCTAAARGRNMTGWASRQRIGRRLYGISRELS